MCQQNIQEVKDVIYKFILLCLCGEFGGGGKGTCSKKVTHLSQIPAQSTISADEVSNVAEGVDSIGRDERGYY